MSPSTESRKFYGHRPERFAEFSKRYRRELGSPAARTAVSELVHVSARKRVTLLTASRDVDHSEAAVLAQHLRALTKRRSTVRRPM